MSDGFLHKYFLNNAGPRIHKWFHYFDIYERHFERFRGKRPVVMEIGVGGGGSLAMWRDYFGDGARIVGLDIRDACKAHEDRDIEIFIGSQSDTAVLERILKRYPHIDVVIDDGSHRMEDLVATFEFLYGKISRQGVYFVEDTHTCYWSDYGGGLRSPDSFMELVKDKLDEINAVHTAGGLPVSDFTRSTQAISVYDSVVVFEKRPQAARQAQKTQAMQ